MTRNDVRDTCERERDPTGIRSGNIYKDSRRCCCWCVFVGVFVSEAVSLFCAAMVVFI